MAKSKAAKPITFPRSTLAIALCGLILTAGGYLLSRKNASVAAEQASAAMQTFLVFSEGKLKSTNSAVQLIHLDIRFPKDIMVSGNVMHCGEGKFSSEVVIELLKPALTAIAERDDKHKGRMIDVPVKIDFLSSYQGRRIANSHAYKFRISGDKLTGDWRFFIADMYHLGHFKYDLNDKQSDVELTRLLRESDVWHTSVSTDGTVP